LATVTVLAFLSVSFFIALGFALKRKQWFKGWFLGALVPVVAFPLVEVFAGPTGWLGVALFFGTLYSIAASTTGLFVAWLTTRINRPMSERKSEEPPLSET
jgi:hypothetical protein